MCVTIFVFSPPFDVHMTMKFVLNEICPFVHRVYSGLRSSSSSQAVPNPLLCRTYSTSITEQ